MWAGIGGIAGAWKPGTNSLLEQAGVSVVCASKTAQSAYKPFWEIADNMQEQSFKVGSPHVRAGDLISAEVVAPEREDSRWYFEVSGLTTGKSRREYYTTLSIW
jgi:hypothetical protein